MKKKNIRKDFKKQFARDFDLSQLNYQSRVKPARGKALIIGFISAATIYLAIYAAAYVAWSNNVIPMDTLAKMVWIMMIPTTIAGFLIWQITRNRFEYPIRKKMRDYITQLEASRHGLLKRYQPMWEAFDGTTSTLKKAIAQSEKADLEKIDIEDYAEAVNKLSVYFETTHNNEWTTTLAQKLEDSFSQN